MAGLAGRLRLGGHPAARAAQPWRGTGPSRPVVQAAGPASRPPQGPACEVPLVKVGPPVLTGDPCLGGGRPLALTSRGHAIHTARPQLETRDQGKVVRLRQGQSINRGPAPSDWLPLWLGLAASLGPGKGRGSETGGSLCVSSRRLGPAVRACCCGELS